MHCSVSVPIDFAAAFATTLASLSAPVSAIKDRKTERTHNRLAMPSPSLLRSLNSPKSVGQALGSSYQPTAADPNRIDLLCVANVGQRVRIQHDEIRPFPRSKSAQFPVDLHHASCAASCGHKRLHRR